MTVAAMALAGRFRGEGTRRGAAALGLALALASGLVLVGGLGASAVRAESAPPPTTPATPPQRPASESGIGWRELNAQQQDDLRPLEREWATIDAPQKRKWLEVAGRMPKMPADERGRIQARMFDWARLTPEQRGQARLRYQQARQVPPRDRQARWDAYQSLPTERKQQLAERAALAASASLAARRTAAAHYRAGHDPLKSAGAVLPDDAAPPRPVAPTLVQARPGATTTSIGRPPAPPSHQRAGMPKIAATPEYVNRSTLLPRHDPQAAAARSASPGSAAASPPPAPSAPASAPPPAPRP